MKPQAGTSPAGGLYGRRKGKALRDEQARRLEVLLPALRIDLSRPIEDVPALFAHRPAQVVLEIGYGGGEHLAHRAAEAPEAGFIGAEFFINGITKFLAEWEARALANTRLFDGNALDLVAALPQASVDLVFILYPDPWPKRRQRKRRILSRDTSAAFARILKPGGELRFASDIDDYVGWALMALAADPRFEWTAERASDWLSPWAGWPGTRYEAKALREGRVPSYLTFRRL